MISGLVSVIIPNWNGAKYLTSCLESLNRQTCNDMEVIVVDNASVDGSQALMRDNFAWATLIELPDNQGFTGACNVGIRAAKGEFVVLLNNDTEVAPDWCAEIVDAFARHPEIGSVASKMLLYDQRDTIHTAGDFFTTDGRPGNRGVWEKDTGQYDHEEFVFSACGGSSAYRRVMLDQIGLLDDRLFFLLEDVDLGWRAQLAGWRCLYTPKAVVYHHLSATGGGATSSYYAGRNLLPVLVKVLPAALWRKHFWKIAAAQWREARSALRAWRGEAARARLRGMLAGIVVAVQMLPQRRVVQKSRTVSLEYLEGMLLPSKPPAP